MRRMIRQAHITPLFLGLVMTPLAACSAPGAPGQDSPISAADDSACEQAPLSTTSPSVAAPPLDGTLDIRIAQEPNSLLPQVDPSRTCRAVVLHQVLGTLLRQEDSPGHFAPELATAFEASEDRLTYVFHLDGSAAWSDGRPLGADDVVHTLRRLIDPTEVLQPRLSELGVVEVIAIDEHTVSVRLVSPNDKLLRTLSQVPILPRHVFEMTEVSSLPEARRPLGSGPYMVDSWIPGQRITLRRNPKWGGAPVHFETVVYHIVPDDRVAISLFESGVLDVVTGMQRRPRHLATTGVFTTYERRETAALVYNAGRPATADPAVRRALSRIVDRSTICCRILDGLASFLETGWPGLLPINKKARRFNPAAATESLEKSGWTRTAQGGFRQRAGVELNLGLLVSEEPGGFERAAALVSEDAARVGIGLSLERLGRRILLERVFRRSFDVAVIAINDDDLSNPTQFLRAGGKGEQLSIDALDLEAQTLFTQFAETPEWANRRALASRLSRRMLDLEPVTFLYSRREGALLHPDLVDPVFERERLDIALLRPRVSRTAP
ncbi:MAG: ABC transporter substrate-binding protein [Myxococcota bacterium]|nr:ABC transporter substrate-binding protein [Myxococcota bacterium]